MITERQRFKKGSGPPEKRFWEKVRKTDGCWLWLGALIGNGYGNFANHIERYAHRFSWVLANGPIPAGLSVLHRCDVPCCVNPAHLFLGTQDDNMKDCKAKGRIDRIKKALPGSSHPNSKLTEAQVIEILSQPKARGSGRELARRFGVCPALICTIRKGETWRHV